VVTRRLEGGRERERKREPARNPHIPTGSLSVSGWAWVSAGDPTFRFRFDLIDVTDLVSRSRRPSQSLAGKRRRRMRERRER
jgi:hypothetical protein